MKVGTPFGDYPFEFRRVERRGDSIALVGIVAGLESSLILDREDLRRISLFAVVPIALIALCRISRRSP